jgi:hypothetical protein
MAAALPHGDWTAEKLVIVASLVKALAAKEFGK